MCPHCQEPFESAHPGKVYCSLRCRTRARENRKRKAKQDRERGGREGVDCAHCGCRFAAKPSAIYCSPRCRAIAKGQRRVNVDREGYVYISVNGQRVLEHRAVMESMIGRPLYDFENVHHMNGVRSDNRPENLELWATPQPAGQRPSDLAKWVVENYPDEVLGWLAQTAIDVSVEAS